MDRTTDGGGSTAGPAGGGTVGPAAGSSGAMGETADPDSTGPIESTSSEGGPDTGDTMACPVGELGCSCDGNSCNDGLMCIRGECSSCGDGVVDGPEECDGPVPGGDCVACQVVCDEGFDDCDRMPDNGCEIDLTSQTNCGACGRDCLGGACAASLCQPVDLAQSQGQPLGLHVQGEFVFWTNVGDDFGAGEVAGHAITPGGPPTQIASGLSFPETVVADDSKVYWANTFGDTAEGGIGQANYDGTGAIAQWRDASEAGNTRLLLDSPTQIFALRLGDGPVVASKVLDTTVSVSGGSAFGGFFDGTFLYWADNGAGEIRRADVSDGAPFAVETLVTGQTLAYAVYVHGDTVYWTTDGTNGGFNGTVRSRLIDGGPTLDIATDVDQPEDLVVDDTHVYWVEWEPNGRVERAEHDGSNRVVLATAFSAGIDHDDTAIYWVDQTGGRIRKLAK